MTSLSAMFFSLVSTSCQANAIRTNKTAMCIPAYVWEQSNLAMGQLKILCQLNNYVCIYTECGTGSLHGCIAQQKCLRTVITKMISGVKDKMSDRASAPMWDIFPVDEWLILVVILVFLVQHFMSITPCWTKCPAGSGLSAGHQQKSAGHVR